MESQKKVLLTMPIFKNNVMISSFVHCSSELKIAHENEEIRVVDCNGVAHRAFIHSCPQTVDTIDIKEFMKIFGKIHRIDDEIPILLEILDEVNNNSV